MRLYEAFDAKEDSSDYPLHLDTFVGMHSHARSRCE